EDFTDQRVVIVGGGNSAAQIVSEVSTVAQTLWVTQRRPRFMPDDVDGRVLFDVATAREAAQRAGRDHDGVSGLGDIVMVPPVRAARDRGDLNASPMFERLTSAGVSWADGSEYCQAPGFVEAPFLGFLSRRGLCRGLVDPFRMDLDRRTVPDR